MRSGHRRRNQRGTAAHSSGPGKRPLNRWRCSVSRDGWLMRDVRTHNFKTCRAPSTVTGSYSYRSSDNDIENHACQRHNRNALNSRSPSQHGKHSRNKNDGNANVAPRNHGKNPATIPKRPQQFEFPVRQSCRTGDHHIGGQLTECRQHCHQCPDHQPIC